MSNNYYVYLHTFSNGKKYVGKGKDSRSTDFRNRSTYWKRVFCKYGEPEIKVVADNLSEAEAFELEEFVIAEMIDSGYKLKDTLINLSLGGEGASGHVHSEEGRKLIGEASKRNWSDPEYREKSINAMKIAQTADKVKKRKSDILKTRWEDEETRQKFIVAIENMWKDPVHVENMRSRMAGRNNPSARLANIYNYKTGELVAEGVVSAEWARQNGLQRPKLQVTTKADRSKPSSKDNPHHHKGYYMEYVDGK